MLLAADSVSGSGQRWRRTSIFVPDIQHRSHWSDSSFCRQCQTRRFPL